MDALLVVDVQKDFLPGGSLAVREGNDVIEPLNRVIRFFEAKRLPIFATRNWHTQNHCSFIEHGGIWPPHCIAETPGAQFPDTLYLPKEATIVSKAMTSEEDAYSGFQDTELHSSLQRLGVSRLYIGGLTTEYCVLTTVTDARRLGYDVYVLEDAIRPVNVRIGDSERAIEQMRQLGANFTTTASALGADRVAA